MNKLTERRGVRLAGVLIGFGLVVELSSIYRGGADSFVTFLLLGVPAVLAGVAAFLWQSIFVRGGR